MPHQCVRCGKLYEDSAHNILEGCDCGSKMFYFIKPDKYKELRKLADEKAKLTFEEREQIEEDIYELMGEDIDPEKPVLLDLETIEVLEPGKYNLDLVKLFQQKQPLIFKLEDGKYYVDLAESFERLTGKKKDKKNKNKKGLFWLY